MNALRLEPFGWKHRSLKQRISPFPLSGQSSPPPPAVHYQAGDRAQQPDPRAW